MITKQHKARFHPAAVLFILIIMIGFFASAKHGLSCCLVLSQGIKTKSFDSATAEYENKYDSFFSSKDICLDIYSLTQRVLCKQETRNFEVLRSKDNSLYLQENGWPTDDETIAEIAGQIQLMRNTVESYGGRFLFVQVPYKSAEMALDLKLYSADKTVQAQDKLIELLNDANIPVLDLRNEADCCEMYATDHHWKLESGFNAATRICEHLEELYSTELGDTEFFGNTDNYDAVCYEDSFLGSIGVKVGKFFVGKDDFTIYNPKFNTELEIKHYVKGELDKSAEGDFWEAFIMEECLLDPNYKNKHGSLLQGAYVETVINNKLSENGNSALLVTHSYGRSMAQYLSLYFDELRYLDPQKGRYNDNYLEYITNYTPDYVIVMYNDLINVGE